jgi:hypothetical protein
MGAERIFATREDSRYAIQNYTSQFPGQSGRGRGGKRCLLCTCMGAF